MKSLTKTPLETYSQVLETIPDAAIIADRLGDIVFVNQSAIQLFGDPGGSLWFSNIQQLIPQELREAHLQHLECYWKHPGARSMAEGDGLEALKQDGSRIPVAIMLNHLDLHEGYFALAICRDMSRERDQQRELQKALDREKGLATTDGLTGAANRRHFIEELSFEIERCSRHRRIFSLAYFDLDNFKLVNDRSGHAEGDRLLKQIVEVAENRLRKTDLIARIGGDEFAVLLPESDSTEMESPITDLLNDMREAMQKEGWPVTVSCGVVTFKEPPSNAEDAIKAADQLMYEVKASGKNASREAVFEGSACRDC